MRFGLFFLAEYINLINVSAIATTLFLGGWRAPWPVSLWPARTPATGRMLWFFDQGADLHVRLRLAPRHAAPDPLRPVHVARLEGAGPGLAGLDRAGRTRCGCCATSRADHRRGAALGGHPAGRDPADRGVPGRPGTGHDDARRTSCRRTTAARATRRTTGSPTVQVVAARSRGRYPVPPLDLKVPSRRSAAAGAARRPVRRRRGCRRRHRRREAAMSFLDPVKGFGVTFATMFKPVVTEDYPNNPDQPAPRYHGRHQLNRHPDGLEKCVGCELCAWACPADAIFVEGGDNTDEERYSPGERYGEELPDQLPALHRLRPVHRGLPDPVADHDQRVRAGRRRPAAADLHQGHAAGPAAARAWSSRRIRCGSATSRTTTSAGPNCCATRTPAIEPGCRRGASRPGRCPDRGRRRSGPDVDRPHGGAE